MGKQLTSPPTAVAWKLVNGSSASGGKDYRILVAHNVVVVGWGSINAPTRQFKTMDFPSPEKATAWAILCTQTKESGGYSLTRQPRTFDLDPVRWGSLVALVGHRGASTFLTNLFADTLGGVEIPA